MKDSLTEDLENVQLGEAVDSNDDEIPEVKKIEMVEEIGHLRGRNESPTESDGVSNVYDDETELSDNEKTRTAVSETALSLKCFLPDYIFVVSYSS